MAQTLKGVNGMFMYQCDIATSTNHAHVGTRTSILACRTPAILPVATQPQQHVVIRYTLYAYLINYMHIYLN